MFTLKAVDVLIFCIALAMLGEVVRANYKAAYNNYFDEIATSACVSLAASRKAGHVAAVRRTCSKFYVDCTAVCKHAGSIPGFSGNIWRFKSMKNDQNHCSRGSHSKTDIIFIIFYLVNFWKT